MDITLEMLTEISYNFINILDRDGLYGFDFHDNKKIFRIKFVYDCDTKLIHFFKDGKYIGKSEY